MGLNPGGVGVMDHNPGAVGAVGHNPGGFGETMESDPHIIALRERLIQTPSFATTQVIQDLLSLVQMAVLAQSKET